VPDNKKKVTCNYCMKPRDSIDECHLKHHTEEAVAAREEATKRKGKEPANPCIAKSTHTKQ
jgi:hypothetical protein